MSVEFRLIGDTAKAPLIPDIPTIVKFASGDIGVCELCQKKTIVENLSKSKSKKTTDTYLKSSNASVKPGTTNKNVQTSDITTSDNGNGPKSLEKTMVTSSFESLKPYVSVGILMIQSLADIEDLIARILGLGTSSLRPLDNPKALSYKLADAKKDMDKLNGLNQTTSSPKSGFPSSTDQKNVLNKITNSNTPTLSLDKNMMGYKILSIEYSTGVKLQNYKYDYTYKVIPNDQLNLSGVDSSKKETLPPDYRPKTVVFGIYNKKGEAIKAPTWLVNSKKWYGQFKSFTSMEDDLQNYTNYLYDSLDINKITDITIKENIKKSIDPQGQLNTVNSQSFVRGFVGENINDPSIRQLNQNAILPSKIIAPNFNNWIDPETEYDLKVIKITPDTKVRLKNNVSVEFSAFIKNGFVFRINDSLKRTSFTSNTQTYTVSLSPVDRTLPTLTVSSDFNSDIVFSNLNVNTSYTTTVTGNNIQISTTLVVQSNTLKTYSIGDGILVNNITQLTPLSSVPINDNYVQVKNTAGKDIIISREDIQNEELVKQGPYSNKYGDNKLGLLHRFPTTEEDLDDIFIVEGIISDYNPEPVSSPFISSSSSDFKRGDSRVWYGKKDSIGAIKVFIKILSRILSEFVPLIISSLVLFKSPFNFLFQIITEKVSKFFSSLSKDSITDSIALASAPKSQRKKIAKDKPNISKSIHVDKNGNTKYLNDGDGMINFLGTNFGISLSKLIPAFKTGTLGQKGISLSKLIPAFKTGTLGQKEQSIYKSILGVVTAPFNLIIKFFEYILDFFTSLNFGNIQSKVTDFITFKWFEDIFKKDKILESAGIKIDFDLLNKWNDDGINLNEKINLNDAISVSFFSSFPTYTASQYKNIKDKPSKLLGGTFCSIEGILNWIIIFIFAVLGLTALFNPPKLGIEDQLTESLSKADLQKSSDGKLPDDILNKPSLLYQVTLPDGRVIKNLDKSKLDKWVKENSNDFNVEFKL
jgi:hypothetical protein